MNDRTEKNLKRLRTVGKSLSEQNQPYSECVAFAQRCRHLCEIASSKHTQRNQYLQSWVLENREYLSPLMMITGVSDERLKFFVKDFLKSDFGGYQEAAEALMRRNYWKVSGRGLKSIASVKDRQMVHGIINVLLYGRDTFPGLLDRYPFLNWCSVQVVAEASATPESALRREAHRYLKGRFSAKRGFDLEKGLARILNQFNVDYQRDVQRSQDAVAWDFCLCNCIFVETTWTNSTGSLISRKKNALVGDIASSPARHDTFVFLGGGEAWEARPSDLRYLAKNFDHCYGATRDQVVEFFDYVLNSELKRAVPLGEIEAAVQHHIKESHEA